MFKRFVSVSIAAFGVIVLATAAPANATLIGDEISYSTFVDGNLVEGPYYSVVGDGPEFDAASVVVDVSASRIDYILLNPLIFGPATQVFGDLDWSNGEGEIIDVMLTTFFDVVADVDFTADSVTINFSDYGNIEPGLYASIELITAPVVTSVPEPTSLALFGADLAALGFARRRRR